MNRLFPLVLFAVLHPALAGGYSGNFVGPWRDDFVTEITISLAKNNIEGCGQYKWLKSSDSDTEFLVSCSRDGKQWTKYVVWTGINKVIRYSDIK